MKDHFPDLHQTILDDATLQSLMDDVSQFGSDIEIIEKTGAQRMVESQPAAEKKPVTLSEVHDALLTGQLRAAQIRYDFDGQRWCDTLTRGKEGGYRLTRISLSQAATVTEEPIT